MAAKTTTTIRAAVLKKIHGMTAEMARDIAAAEGGKFRYDFRYDFINCTFCGTGTDSLTDEEFEAVDEWVEGFKQRGEIHTDVILKHIKEKGDWRRKSIGTANTDEHKVAAYDPDTFLPIRNGQVNYKNGYA